MKHDIVNTLIIAAGLALFAGCVTGCNTTTFSKSSAGDVVIHNTRWFWSTDSYTANWTTNGASLEVNKSGVDAAALGAVVQAAVTAAKP